MSNLFNDAEKIFNEVGAKIDSVGFTKTKEEIDKWHKDEMNKINEEYKRKNVQIDNLFEQINTLMASGDNEAIKRLLEEASNNL